MNNIKINRVKDWCIGAIGGNFLVAIFGLAMLLFLLEETNVRNIENMPACLQACGNTMRNCIGIGLTASALFSTIYIILLNFFSEE